MTAKKVLLGPMTDQEYVQCKAESNANYAKEKVTAGTWPEEGSLERAQAEYDRLAPHGIKTPGHFFLTVREFATADELGIIWLAQRGQWDGAEKKAWVFDIVIAPKYRGQGFGRAAMLAAEEFLRPLGFKELGLHVFGHNVAAKSLYESLGYATTDVSMAKPL